MLDSTVRRLRSTALVLVALIACVPLAEADVPPPSRVLSNYETGQGKILRRDIGMSVPLPPMPGQQATQNRSAWIFGDTALTDSQGNDEPYPFRPGTFAAITPYTPGLVPTSLSEVPPPPTPFTFPNSGMPQLLVPRASNTEVKLPNGLPCTGTSGSYEALYPTTWPFGATRGPQGPMTLYNGSTPVSVADGSQLVFLSMADACVYKSALTAPCADGDVWSPWAPIRWTFQRTKLVAWRPSNNTIVATMPLFATSDGSCLPWQKQVFYQAIFRSGHLYLYSTDCDTYVAGFGSCVNGKVTVARAPIGSLHNSAAYQWANGQGGWTSNFASAASVLPNSPGPLMIDVHDFSSAGEGLLLLEQTSWGGHYNLYEATNPAGPWTLKRNNVRMTACRTGNGEGCYNLYGHPELSTPGHLMYSYYNVTEQFVIVTDTGGLPPN